MCLQQLAIDRVEMAKLHCLGSPFPEDPLDISEYLQPKTKEEPGTSAASQYSTVSGTVNRVYLGTF